MRLGADEEAGAGAGAGVVEGVDADTYMGVDASVGKVLGMSRSWERNSSLRDKKPVNVSNTHRGDKRDRVKGNGKTHTAGRGYFEIDTGHT